jgi:hypothetical protein
MSKPRKKNPETNGDGNGAAPPDEPQREFTDGECYQIENFAEKALASPLVPASTGESPRAFAEWAIEVGKEFVRIMRPLRSGSTYPALELNRPKSEPAAPKPPAPPPPPPLTDSERALLRLPAHAVGLEFFADLPEKGVPLLQDLLNRRLIESVGIATIKITTSGEELAAELIHRTERTLPMEGVS